MKDMVGRRREIFKIKRKTFVSTFVFLVIAIILWVHLDPAIAATITVTNTNDSGAGSLRDAVGNALPGDTINFGITGTIILTSGVLVIHKNLTITGPGSSSLSVSGNHSSPVFNITTGSVTISDITIRDGNNPSGAPLFGFGGGVLNGGTTTLLRVRITNNTAASAGGGINNGGTMTLTNCTVDGNKSSFQVGAILNNSVMTLTNTTVSSNTAANAVGGIENLSATMTLTNCTVSGNTAPSGFSGIYNTNGGGTMTLTNVTITDNSGGVSSINSATATLRNTIVANNTDANCHGTLTSNGHNLSSDNTCGFGGSGDQNNVSNPLLGPLALNLPGNTQTHALLPGSPAIDAADPLNFPPTDQRGITRPQGSGPDIGAYEFVSVSVPSISVPTITEWGMIILVIFFGVTSVYYIRRRRVEV